MSTRRIKILAAVLGTLLMLAAIVAALNLRDEVDVNSPPAWKPTPELAQRGAYLALAGNCAACHTARGGAAYAGGLGIDTPFGTVFASNITPDPDTGIGRWTAAEFYRAMHNGRSRDGHLLYPAFPYPNFTQVTREDSDALFAWLQSQPPVKQANAPHTLRFPYNTQASLAVWRAMFFDPGNYRADAGRSAQWNRGSYLVRGLGHCNACHASRNIFGATSERLELSGGLIPMQKWYAPALTSSREAGVAQWETAHVVALLRDGISPRASVMGPMAEVVYRSTQHLSAHDLEAIAVFLKSLPQAHDSAPAVKPLDLSLLSEGSKIYEKHCEQCHGDKGQGVSGAYPALAGNRAVTMGNPANLVRAVVSGGYPPTTMGNPRPFGMPPFGQALDDSQIAAVLSYVRASWGNQAPAVSTLEVLQFR
ncbi:c-type cytochrome [Piscinibacter terrae]|uniref:Cytochrome c n=1 Tax=Piscinibacter terrae TaxID=2496871 RepID=A0A3N7JKX5_9BURK|nr:cytochrome c [Albitalea terrae]RQP21949.1 cytochrome c [Albitalea terrae]